MKRFALLIAVLTVFAIIAIGWTRQRKPPQPPVSQLVEVLSPKLSANDSARFHPLLRESDKNSLNDPKFTKLKAYLLLNSETGEVYSAKSAIEKIPPASLTKLVTAMVALDVSTSSAVLSASNKAAAQEPTVLGVKVGETFTLEELTTAMITTSANDATTIVSEEVLKPYQGDESVFVALMNKKAELLGLGNTHFTNSQGFDDDKQFTNAYDLARIAHYAYRNYPLIRQAAATRYTTLEKTDTHGFYHLPNWNALLGSYPGVDGLKIGYTDTAGHSTIVTAKRKDTQLIAIVIGAESIIDRDLAAATLLNFGFKQDGIKPVIVNEALIKPRLDEWRQLRDKILKELENEKTNTQTSTESAKLTDQE